MAESKPSSPASESESQSQSESESESESEAESEKPGTPPRVRGLQVPDLEEFDYSAIEPESTFLYVGKRREGKTVALLNNLHALVQSGFLQGAIVISKTENANMTYQQYVLRDYIYSGWQPDLYAKLKDKMQDLRFLYDMHKVPHPGFISVILDDMISEKAMFYDRDLTDMFVAGRHYFLNVHITTQYPKAVPPRVRDNADYVVLFQASGPSNRDKLYEDYGSGLTKEEFFLLLARYTQDFHCLVFRNRRPAEKGEIPRPGEWAKEGTGGQTAPGAQGASAVPTTESKIEFDYEVSERGKVLDAHRFENYFVIRYPFPIPAFHLGSRKTWEEQERVKENEAETLLLHYQGIDLGELAKEGESTVQKLHKMGASGYILDWFQQLNNSHSERWAYK